MMNVSEIEWRDYCCGDACQYAEVKTSAGTLQIKTSHDANDLSYLVRRYGLDDMPVDPGYVPMTEAQVAMELAAI